jgi:hypothetical protein
VQPAIRRGRPPPSEEAAFTSHYLGSGTQNQSSVDRKEAGGTASGRALLFFPSVERLLALANEGIAMAFGESAGSSGTRPRRSGSHSRDERERRLVLTAFSVEERRK